MKMKGLLAICLMHTLYLSATPTSLFWTNCTTGVQQTGTFHIGVDNYFTVFNPRGHGSSFPPDVGLTVGAFDFHNLQAEVGIDYLGGTDYPLFFNGKIGLPENMLFSHAPSWSLGIFNCGTRTHGSNRTNQNIADFVIGKTVPGIGGNLYLGVFSGSKAMGPDRQGVMVGYNRAFCHTQDASGKEYAKWSFAADYASGKNTIGGGGVAVQYNFTPTISILTGPVWFNSHAINGRWKWSIQLDIDLM